MKARQLATSFASAYALGLLDQVRVIRRGPDGFWGAWEATGVNAKRVVHGRGFVALIGLDDRIAIYDELPGRPRLTWDFQASELSYVPLPHEGGALFALSAGRIWQARKSSATAPWSNWEWLGGPAGRLATGLIRRGGPVVCCSHAGTVYHIWQEDPDSGWSSWESLGSPDVGAGDIALTSSSRGGLAVFATGRDGALYHRWQRRPLGQWHQWESLGGLVTSFSVTRTASGGLAALIAGPDGRVSARYQPKPFAPWTAWLDLQGHARHVVIQQSYTEGLEAFVLGTDDEIRHAWCPRLGAPWTEWQLLDRETSSLRLASVGASAPRPDHGNAIRRSSS